MGTCADKRLVRRALAGDREACVQLVHDHHADVYRLLVYLCRDGHLAEDLTQETFAAAWAGLEEFGGASSLKTWLHRIAYRKFLDSRRRRNVVINDKSGESDVVDDCSPDPVMAMIADERTRQLYEALDHLPADERDAIVLHYLQGMTYEQMAEALQTPAGTCKWRINQAVKRLRRLLAGNENYEVGRAAD